MFWDSSAVVPVFLPETRSAELARALADDHTPVIWWATPIECHAAIYRRNRPSAMPAAIEDDAHSRLDKFCEDADQVQPSDPIRRRALRVLSVHRLRAADALQLAAALLLCEENPKGQQFVCLDDRLRDAARAEGFDVRP